MKPMPMPKYLLVLLLLCLAQTAIGQPTLRQQFDNTQLADSARLDALVRHAYRLYAQDSAKALLTYDTAINLAQQWKQPAMAVTASNSRSLLLTNYGHYAQAHVFWQQSLALADKLNQAAGKGNAMFGTGLNWYYQQQYDSAIAWQNRAIAHFKAIGREDKLALSYNNLASSYLHTSQYPLALTHYLNAIKVAEKNADTSGIITYTGNAGMVYKYMSKYNEAMQHYQKALHLAKAVGNQEYQATYFQKIAIIYDCKDSAGQAIPWYRQAIALNTAIENERALGENFSNIGIAFASLNQPDSAWLYLNKGLPYLRRFGDTRALAVVLKEKAVLLAKAPSGWLSAHGFSPLSAKARAVAMLQEAVAAFEEVDNLFDQSQTWEALYELHKQLGQTGAALVALEHHAQLQDSIFNDGTKEQILSTRLQYEQEIKDAVSKANYEAEIKRQQWNQRAILVVGIGLILAGLVFFALYKRRKEATQQLVLTQLQSQLADMENKALRSQMNPHFIFNSLNCISQYIRHNQAQLADDYLAAFARLIRLVLQNSEQKEVSLADDLEALQLYMQLEAQRMGKKLHYNLQMAPDINAAEVLVPPLLVQPFVENSIWHGIAPKEEGGKIDIDIHTEEHQLVITITDDGIGKKLTRPDETARTTQPYQAEQEAFVNKHTSLGTRITAARIALQNKLTGSQSKIEYLPVAVGTCAQLKLPYNLAF